MMNKTQYQPPRNSRSTFFYHRLSTEKYGLMVKCSDYVVKQTWIQVHDIGQAIFASVGLPFSICDVGIRQNMQLKVFTVPVAQQGSMDANCLCCGVGDCYDYVLALGFECLK